MKKGSFNRLPFFIPISQTYFLNKTKTNISCYINMTIFDYTSLPIISIPYILRDEDNTATSVKVYHQETKEVITLSVGSGAEFYSTYFTVDVTTLSGINENTSLLVSALDSNSNPIYRDIVVFEQRLDTVSDYEQNDANNEYIFVD